MTEIIMILIAYSIATQLQSYYKKPKDNDWF